MSKWFYCPVSALVFLLPQALQAAAFERQLSYDPDIIFLAAKRYILSSSKVALKEDVIFVEDASSGFLKFRLDELPKEVPGLVLEIIDRGETSTKVRFTFDSLSESRAQLFFNRLEGAIQDEYLGNLGKELPFDSASVFSSIKRYLLKTQLRPGEGPGTLFQFEDSDVGLLKFRYTDRSKNQTPAMVRIVSRGLSGSRLFVDLPQRSNANALLLQSQIVESVEKDLRSPRS